MNLNCPKCRGLLELSDGPLPPSVMCPLCQTVFQPQAPTVHGSQALPDEIELDMIQPTEPAAFGHQPAPQAQMAPQPAMQRPAPSAAPQPFGAHVAPPPAPHAVPPQPAPQAPPAEQVLQGASPPARGSQRGIQTLKHGSERGVSPARASQRGMRSANRPSEGRIPIGNSPEAIAARAAQIQEQAQQDEVWFQEKFVPVALPAGVVLVALVAGLLAYGWLGALIGLVVAGGGYAGFLLLRKRMREAREDAEEDREMGLEPMPRSRTPLFAAGGLLLALVLGAAGYWAWYTFLRQPPLPELVGELPDGEFAMAVDGEQFLALLEDKSLGEKHPLLKRAQDAYANAKKEDEALTIFTRKRSGTLALSVTAGSSGPLSSELFLIARPGYFGSEDRSKLEQELKDHGFERKDEQGVQLWTTSFSMLGVQAVGIDGGTVYIGAKETVLAYATGSFNEERVRHNKHWPDVAAKLSGTPMALLVVKGDALKGAPLAAGANLEKEFRLGALELAREGDALNVRGVVKMSKADTAKDLADLLEKQKKDLSKQVKDNADLLKTIMPGAKPDELAKAVEQFKASHDGVYLSAEVDLLQALNLGQAAFSSTMLALSGAMPPVAPGPPAPPAEAAAIARCKTYAEAQDAYRRNDWDKDDIQEYATSLKALHQPDPAKPGSALIDAAFAAAEGEPGKAVPADGYVFKVLLGQGPGAPGGAKSYLGAGENLLLGYALLAVPAKYGEGTKRSFIVNNTATVYAKDLGADSTAQFKLITTYDPSGWELAE